jgi:ribonuclease P protein component
LSRGDSYGLPVILVLQEFLSEQAKAIRMYTFKKEERLCSKKLLEKLFHNGSSFLLYPFRIVWLPSSLSDPMLPVQVVINVPKRRFKHATDRNLIKRRVREVYRLHKGELLYPFLIERESQIILSINYIGKEISEYPLIEKKLKASLEKLKTVYNEHVVE